MADAIHCTINGEALALPVRPDTTLLDILRNELSLKGTKEGCSEGDCGACTVLVRRDGINGGARMAANSCIMTAAQIEGAKITTVEGLPQDGLPTALQAAMAANGSSQCGFCTPGIVMAASGLLENDPQPDESAIHDALAGNLCRCTGYRPIVDAIRQTAAAQPAGADVAESPADAPANATSIAAGGAMLHRPGGLRALLRLVRDNPDAVLLAGGTDLGVARAAYETDWPVVITTDRVRELRKIARTSKAHTFGAAVTWQEVLEAVAGDYPSFATLIRRFGSTQIRSMGTIGGNIGTASPIGDGPPALIALGATIELASLEGGKRTMALEEFFIDYRKTALRSDEVIVSVSVPRPKPGEHFRVWKVSKRYDQDISTVCGAFWLRMDGDRIAQCRVAFGGMAATPKRAPASEAALTGKPLSAESARAAGAALETDYAPLSDWRGSADYRLRVAKGLSLRLLHDLAGVRTEVMA